MREEHWYIMKGDEFLTRDYEIDLSVGEKNGTVIKLIGKDTVITLNFGNVRAIRLLDEGLVQKYLYENVYINGEKGDSFDHLFYKAENSEFFDFVNKVSCNMAKMLEVKHYIILTMNYNIEILTEFEPDIQVNRSGQKNGTIKFSF